MQYLILNNFIKSKVTQESFEFLVPRNYLLEVGMYEGEQKFDDCNLYLIIVTLVPKSDILVLIHI